MMLGSPMLYNLVGLAMLGITWGAVALLMLIILTGFSGSNNTSTFFDGIGGGFDGDGGGGDGGGGGD